MLRYVVQLACAIITIILGFGSPTVARAVYLTPDGTNHGAAYTPLDSWSFQDNVNWTSDHGYYPITFTNLNFSYLGDGASLVVNSNVPVWLQYNVFETNGTTNLTVDIGSIAFWFAPNWASTNQGGSGPGDWANLIDVGEYTTNSDYGFWGLYVDPVGQNLIFSAQTNDLSGTLTTYLIAPISWTTNYWHYIVLTYSTTNTALYLDGVLVTNGPPVTLFPGTDVLANGLYMGSDTNGIFQAQGMFNSVSTYNVPVDNNTIQEWYSRQYGYYLMNPANAQFMANLVSAPSTATSSDVPDVITGPGFLLWVTNLYNNVSSTNVWMTNITARATGGGNMTLSFLVEGGLANSNYDVFATSVLQSPFTNTVWYWMGQGPHFNTYTLSNMPSSACYLILGTPQDTTGDGLTDAYKLLVLKASPTNYSSDGTGMADGWEVLYFGHIGVSPTGDPDGDGLTTFQEWLMHSKNYNPVQWNSFTNSVVGDGYQNYSGDGLANLMQASFGGNMLTNNISWKVNTSGDGLPDEYKTMVGLSTNVAASVSGLPVYSMNPIQ